MLIAKYAILIISIAAMLAFPTVYAYWQYSHAPVYVEPQGVSTHMNEFYYPPAEIVPGDDNATSLGENHLLLITEIIEETDYGLNATKKPIIHNYLENPGDVIYCSQNVQGGNLKHLMIDGVEGANRLYFVVLMVSETEYHTFTMLYSDIEDNEVGTEIIAYRTVMREVDGIWKSIYSHRGLAKVNDPGIVSKAVDVTSWRMFENH